MFYGYRDRSSNYCIVDHGRFSIAIQSEHDHDMMTVLACTVFDIFSQGCGIGNESVLIKDILSTRFLANFDDIKRSW